ncbi:hypothetical protein DFA_10557 [Cavenderia fasciculata]|uniref:Uncharacterized protein n=1 Tax=Cavenderia fasciculata TaxID=261658 RepID=F4QAJ6_CACFS|nr:uncharacterized protein DFA_10557 [Cavenderia fasciculata]EGG15715.1 hypothetical protein DFA_10557 [Cavenderia fasciculata]|eukprot:XP_004354457.1 hypothetical protein DFA_10557 [Cavenderia fasciculata]
MDESKLVEHCTSSGKYYYPFAHLMLHIFTLLSNRRFKLAFYSAPPVLSCDTCSADRGDMYLYDHGLHLFGSDDVDDMDSPQPQQVQSIEPHWIHFFTLASVIVEGVDYFYYNQSPYQQQEQDHHHCPPNQSKPITTSIDNILFFSTTLYNAIPVPLHLQDQLCCRKDHCIGYLSIDTIDCTAVMDHIDCSLWE